MAVLAQPTYPVAIYPHFIARIPSTILLTRPRTSLRSLSTPLLRIRFKSFSLSERAKAFDAEGNHVFEIVPEFFHRRLRFRLEDGRGQVVMRVESQSWWSPWKRGGATIVQEGEERVLSIQRRGFVTTVALVGGECDTVVAHFDSKPFRKRDWIDADTYVVTVAPGVDMALMAALCFCLDDREYSQSWNAGLLPASEVVGREAVRQALVRKRVERKSVGKKRGR